MAPQRCSTARNGTKDVQNGTDDLNHGTKQASRDTRNHSAAAAADAIATVTPTPTNPHTHQVACNTLSRRFVTSPRLNERRPDQPGGVRWEYNSSCVFWDEGYAEDYHSSTPARRPERIEGYLVPVVRIHDAHKRVGRVSDACLLGVQQRHEAHHVLPVAEFLTGGHDVEGEPHQGVVKESACVVVVIVVVLVVPFTSYTGRHLYPIPQESTPP